MYRYMIESQSLGNDVAAHGQSLPLRALHMLSKLLS